MLAAVTVDIDTNEVLIYTIDELLDICCNLIIFDEEERILRFAHLSVREFLEKSVPRDDFSLQSRELFLMNRCLYSFLYESHYLAISREQSDKIILQSEVFTTYAGYFWPENCKLGQPDVVTSKFLKDFIGNNLDMGHNAPYKKWIQTITHYDTEDQGSCYIESYVFNTNSPPSMSEISCIYGLTGIIMTLQQDEIIDWNAPMKDEFGVIHYPLKCAAKAGYVIIVRQFLSRYSDHYTKGSTGHRILRLSLSTAIKVSKIEVVKTILDYGMIDVNDRLTKKFRGRYVSRILLSIAVRYNAEEMVKFLLQYGADLSGETRSVTPFFDGDNELEGLEDNHESVHKQNLDSLEIAVLQCDTAIVDAFCSSWVDIMVKDSSGATLIHCLAKGDPGYMGSYYSLKYENIIQYLIWKGVDIAAIDKYQCTALHVAVNYDNNFDKLVPVLVNFGMPMNAQNSEGDTALSMLVNLALIRKFRWRVSLLLSLGADFSIPNNDGLTALDKAEKLHKEIHPKNYQQWAIYSYIVQILTAASQDKAVEDIWRLFVDDS
ncbi:hypothetical protein BOTNAR_0236g00060 [Botryotinia narcissicola]|uniref:Uncharacterized protein n=1 Tax=Botryotinia narcissicola TaxID=278944 RepID=A0A4Z1I2E6_9HELO|nr:hypothetical protein BOTNAR_0236g00060 [Botryotinia narcissicola]